MILRSRARPSTTRSLTRIMAADQDDEPTAVRIPSRESIIYDSRTGRFYEKEIEALCREEFCAVDEKTGKPIVLSIEEKERIFVEALQAYYYDGREVLSDSDFDQLKEDLMWEGSEVAALNRDETKFLAAMSAYLAGNPIMSDSEFDALKTSLKSAGSPIAVSKEPKCFVDTGICSVTWTPNKLRQLVSYIPVAAVIITVWVTVAFEFTPLRYVNPLVTLVVGSPFILFGTKLFAETIFFSNPLIASGPCPDCSTENHIFFGSVLGVDSFQDEGSIKCSNCKAELTIQRNTLRVSSPPKFDFPEDGNEAAAA